MSRNSKTKKKKKGRLYSTKTKTKGTTKTKARVRTGQDRTGNTTEHDMTMSIMAVAPMQSFEPESKRRQSGISPL